jgi:hypothetical protein
MESKLFIPETRATIEKTIIALLNGNQLMNYNTVNSPRAIAAQFRGFWKRTLQNVCRGIDGKDKYIFCAAFNG